MNGYTQLRNPESLYNPSLIFDKKSKNSNPTGSIVSCKNKELQYEFKDNWTEIKSWINKYKLNSSYKSILLHTPSPSFVKKINDRLGEGEIELQLLKDTLGSKVNIDFYYLDIFKMPEFYSFTSIDNLLHDIRRYFNLLVEGNNYGDYDLFSPYDKSEELLWNSNNPYSCVVSIYPGWAGPGYDDLTVAVSKLANESTLGSHWYFSTVWSKKNKYHAVSGNRVFGIIELENNEGYRFYTAAIDGKSDTRGPDWAYDVMNRYKLGDEFWRKLFSNMECYINNLKGESTFGNPYRANVPKDDLETFLDVTHF
jgi:hypothetical protein